jgi:hypothetical protein
MTSKYNYRRLKSAGWWVDTALQMNGRVTSLKTFVKLTLQHEMLASLRRIVYGIFYCPKMELMTMLYLCQTHLIKLYGSSPWNILFMSHGSNLMGFFSFSSLPLPPPPFSLPSLSLEAYSLWKSISYLGNLNVIFYEWCLVQHKVNL